MNWRRKGDNIIANGDFLIYIAIVLSAVFLVTLIPTSLKNFRDGLMLLLSGIALGIIWLFLIFLFPSERKEEKSKYRSD